MLYCCTFCCIKNRRLKMNAINYTIARKNLAKIIENVCEDNNPVIITKSSDCAVVMMSLVDYQSLIETDYLLRTPANVEHLLRSIASAERSDFRSFSEENLEEILNTG